MSYGGDDYGGESYAGGPAAVIELYADATADFRVLVGADDYVVVVPADDVRMVVPADDPWILA